MLEPSHSHSARVFKLHIVRAWCVSMYKWAVGQQKLGFYFSCYRPLEATIQFQCPRLSDANDDRINMLRVASPHYSSVKDVLLGNVKPNSEETKLNVYVAMSVSPIPVSRGCQPESQFTSSKPREAPFLPGEELKGSKAEHTLHCARTGCRSPKP